MTPPPPLPGRYAFDRFQLAADGSLLLSDGAVIPLAPKVLQTLLALVRRAGHVVTKDELLAAVWPGCFVEETGLARNISVLRQGLGDGQQRLIVTVPKVGYRLAARVERVGGEREQAAPLTRGVEAFVGRDAERRRLHQAFDHACQGRGGVLALAGEPGIGKTTLVDHFMGEIHGQCAGGTGRCSESFAGAEPHLPFLEALETLLRLPWIDASMRLHAPTWASYVGLPRTDPAPDGAAPATTPERLLRELTHFLRDVSAQSPVVLCLDDMHWADAATVDVVAHLATRVARMRVLVLLTYRDRHWLQGEHPFARLRDELRARREIEEVALPLLTSDDVGAYVSAAQPGRPVTEGLAALVFRRSEGNPLFMSALLRFLEAPRRGSQADGPGLDVPDSLRGLIDRMLLRLEPAQRATLDAAAVLGEEFDTAVLSRALGRDDATVEDLLASVEQVSGLVQLQCDDETPRGVTSRTYRFRHALYRASLLTQLAPSRRAAWARQLAEAMLDCQGASAPAIAGPVGMLLEDAREYARAAEWFSTASANATRMLAFDDASDLADRGLRCVTRAQGIPPRERMRLELALTFAKLVPFSSARGYGHPRVEVLVQRAAELATEPLRPWLGSGTPGRRHRGTRGDGSGDRDEPADHGRGGPAAVQDNDGGDPAPPW